MTDSMRRLPGVLFAGILVLALASTLAGANLLTNGDFSAPLSEGWQVSSSADQPQVDRLSDKAGGVTVSQDYKGQTSLYQMVPVTDLALTASFSAEFHATVNKPDFTALADVMISYLGADTSLLGQTMYVRSIGDVGLQDGPTVHLITVKKDSAWADYGLNLNDEVSANLTGVSAADVKFVEVSVNADNGTKEGC